MNLESLIKNLSCPVIIFEESSLQHSNLLQKLRQKDTVQMYSINCTNNIAQKFTLKIIFYHFQISS